MPPAIHATPPQAILTRPAHQAEGWLAALGQFGVRAENLPLIEIQPMQGPAFDEAQQRIDDGLDRWDAIMHVSGSAVQHFWQPARLRRWLALWQAQPVAIADSTGGDPALRVPRLWAPGPGTAQALLALGLPATAIDQPRVEAGQFDSEALWQQVEGRIGEGSRVLIVRGRDGNAADTANAAVTAATSALAQALAGHGRDWLSQALRQRGAEVELLAVYRRICPSWNAHQRALAGAAAAQRKVWVFSSSEALHHLAQLLPGHDWAAHRAIATHARIVQKARALGFGTVRESRPTPQDVAQAIKSLP